MNHDGLLYAVKVKNNDGLPYAVKSMGHSELLEKIGKHISWITAD